MESMIAVPTHLPSHPQTNGSIQLAFFPLFEQGSTNDFLLTTRESFFQGAKLDQVVLFSSILYLIVSPYALCMPDMRIEPHGSSGSLTLRKRKI